ncbi:hypothetical protein [Sporosarcina sp. FSL K6-1508]|uniref:hypothetical protein n=1 Tax=Sporosarcina sp. FSL K6-1508 TaxID=2921553 RepID=UPI0030FA42A1
MVKGEVWEPSAAGPDLPKPHLVLREGAQSSGEAYADFTTVYEVWPYVERTTFKRVDELSKEVIGALHRKRFDVQGIPHYIEYAGTATEDIVDEEWDALTRGLRFQVYSLAWLLHAPIDPDPVTAMRLWSAERFPELQTNPTAWSPSNSNPALYWRQESTSAIEPTSWGSWLTMQLRGHIISPDVSIRRVYVEQVVRRLAIDNRTYMTDGSKMNFQTAAADSGYDPFGQGQITLTVKFGVLKDAKNLSFLKHVYFDEKLGGESHV